jgi:site-specific DNA recombinase
MTRRAGLYDRLSLAKLTDTATDDAQSRQQERSRAFATAKGWEVVEVFSDVDRSAYRAPGQKAPPRREQFERALAAVEAGEIDALVFFKLDRLCRDHGDFERVLATCERHGAVLAS